MRRSVAGGGGGPENRGCLDDCDWGGGEFAPRPLVNADAKNAGTFGDDALPPCARGSLMSTCDAAAEVGCECGPRRVGLFHRNDREKNDF
jgi:hypothetical protein